MRILAIFIVAACMLPWLHTRHAVAQEQGTHIVARDLMPLDQRHKRFKIIEGKNVNSMVTVQLQPTGRDGQWLLSVQGINRSLISYDAEGNLVLHRLEIIDQNKGVKYDPPVILLPAEMTPGASMKMKAQAIIYDLETDQITRRGTCTHQVEQVAKANFDTPTGSIDGFYVEVYHHVNLDMAELTINLSQGVQKGEGLIYRHVTWRLQKIGIFDEVTRRTISLARE